LLVRWHSSIYALLAHFAASGPVAVVPGNLQTFLSTCTVTGPLFANDQRSGLNRLFVTGASNRLFEFRGSSPSPEVPLAPIGAAVSVAHY